MNRINHDVSFALAFVFAAALIAWLLGTNITLNIIAAVVGLFLGKAAAEKKAQE